MKKHILSLLVLPIAAFAGAAVWLLYQEGTKLINSTHAHYVLWTMLKSEDVTVSDIAQSPYFDKLSNEDLRDLIDESVMDGKPEITAMLKKKLRDRMNNI